MSDMPPSMMSFMNMPKILPCPYCKARPKLEYSNVGNGMKFRYYCHGVSHVIRSLEFDSKEQAARDWNMSVEQDTRERRER